MAFVNVDGEQIYYEDSGGSLPAVVLLHGFLLDRTMWSPAVASLSGRYRCITVDTRGHGLSSATTEFTCWDTARDVVAVLDRLDIERATVAGLSQGGWTALRTVLSYPERVNGLVLVSTSVLPFDPALGAGFSQMRDAWVTSGPLGEVLEANLASQFGPGDAAVHHDWVLRWQARTPAAWSNPWSAIIERINEPDLTPRLAEVACPTAFVHGSDDLAFSVETAEAGNKLFSDGRGVTVINGAAHASAVTHPREVGEALERILADFHRG